MSVTARSRQPLPSELESPNAKLVYLYLRSTGEATATDLQRDLSMPKLSILSICSRLSSVGLVDRDGTTYTCT